MKRERGGGGLAYTHTRGATRDTHTVLAAHSHGAAAEGAEEQAGGGRQPSTT